MSRRNKDPIPLGIAKDEQTEDYRVIVLAPYVPITALLSGYVLTGLIFGILGIFVLILVGIGALISENFSLVSVFFFILMLTLSLILHFYVVKPARKALRPYVRLFFYNDYLVIEQVFPEIVRFHPLKVPYSSIKNVEVFEAKSLGYRVGIICAESVLPRTKGIVFLGSFGDKKNATAVRNYLFSVISKYKSK